LPQYYGVLFTSFARRAPVRWLSGLGRGRPSR
jgi:hypothetical protein